MDITNFVINRVRRGTMFSTTNGEALWSLTQISDPSLSVTTENSEAVDAMGTRIAQFERGKAATLSANNALMDLALLAAQGGTEMKKATAETKVVLPKWEEIVLTAEQIKAGSVTLGEAVYHPDSDGLPFIYTLNGDSTLKKKFARAAAAADNNFAVSGKTLSLPKTLKEGDVLWVPYEYEATSGVEVSNTAVDFPKAGKFVMEVLGADVCDPTKVYYAYIVFPNAKLQGQFDLDFTTDGTHPFTIEAMQEYCDREKRLFSLRIPETV